MEAKKKEEKCNSSGSGSGAPSSSSSPSHEFSFTISLHSSSSSSSTTTASAKSPQKIKHQEISPLEAIDLTPADEIFFHGHLLPLHFLSHLHAAAAAASPRHSTTSIDSVTVLPAHEEQEEEETATAVHIHELGKGDNENLDQSKGRKHFSLFKWRKGSSSSSESKDQKRKVNSNKFDVSQFVKKYVKPLLQSPIETSTSQFRRQTYSFSGTHVGPRERKEIRGRRGEFSAPASMRTSPTNSGLLLATSGVSSPSSDSTMEELQAAIQAAIAHCKNSIGGADQNKPTGVSAVPVT